MTVEQYVQIVDWLKENKYRIEKEGMTQLEAALFAEKELGFKVPLSSIQRCAKLVKVKWPKSPPGPLPVPIEREAIIILISALAGLYVETGRTIPNSLADLQSAYVRKSQDGQKDPV